MSITSVGIGGSSLFLDFVRCQRGDGTFYGTGGKCRKGREVDPRKVVDKLVQGLSPTKGAVFRSALDPREGLIGKGKDLGNGVSVVKGDSTVLEKLGRVFGLPRPTAKVLNGENEVIVARKSIKPWQNLRVPREAMTPFRKDNPMAMFLDPDSMVDIDFSVNPTLLTANSLLKPAYDRYNKEFFGGKLPKVGLFVAPSASEFAGLTVTAGFTKEARKFIGLSMKLLKYASEEAIHGVLLHEMVHVHDYANGRWDEGHGKIFTTKLEEINKKWRRDTKGVFVDQIAFEPTSMTPKQKRETDGRQFPQIKLSVDFLMGAVDDSQYRFMKWK